MLVHAILLLWRHAHGRSLAVPMNALMHETLSVHLRGQESNTLFGCRLSCFFKAWHLLASQFTNLADFDIKLKY